MIAPRGLVLLLLAASATGFELFAERQDGRGVCATDERKYYEKDFIPTFNILGERQVVPPEDEEKWTTGWEAQNLEFTTQNSIYIELDHRKVVADGSSQFKGVDENSESAQFANLLIQAANATVLWAENRNWRSGKSVRVHLNHLAGRGGKSTWADLCTDLDTAAERCERFETLQDNSGGRDVLNEGREWAWLHLAGKQDNLTLSIQDGQTLIKWRAKNEMKFAPKFLFARTHSMPGVFWVPLHAEANPVVDKTENALSRDFKVGPEGKLCLDVKWEWFFYGDAGRFQVLNSAGQVVRQGAVELERAGLAGKTRLELDLGSGGGDFRFRLLDLKKSVQRISSCREGAGMKVWSASKGCAAFESRFYNAPTASFSSAQLNSSVSVDLTLEQMQKVCAALKVRPGEELKLSCKSGAVFKKCP